MTLLDQFTKAGITHVKSTSERLKFLYKQGILRGINATESHTGSNLLHWCVINDNIPLLEELLDTFGAKIDAKNSINGNTALHYAVVNDNKAAVQALVYRGADLNITNEEGKTAADMVSTTTDPDISQELTPPLPKDPNKII